MQECCVLLKRTDAQPFCDHSQVCYNWATHIKIFHYKRATWANCFLLFKKSNVSDSLVIWANYSQKINKSLKKFIFDSFISFLCPQANCSHSSLLIHSFLKIDLSDSLLSLFTKEWAWVIRSWQKTEAMGVICSVSQANRSITHKKWVNHSKNQWANSQPWRLSVTK